MSESHFRTIREIPTRRVISKPASLLIPEELWKSFAAMSGGRRIPIGNILHFLIWKYGAAAAMGRFPSGDLRKRYQPSGLGLVRVDFRPGVHDWAILSQISQGTGLSRCLIFAILLEMHVGSLSNDGVPTLPRRGPLGLFRGVAWISVRVLDIDRQLMKRHLLIRETG